VRKHHIYCRPTKNDRVEPPVNLPLVAPPTACIDPTKGGHYVRKESLSYQRQPTNKLDSFLLTTIGKHAIPQRSIALAAMPSDGSSVHGPHAAQIIHDSAVDTTKSKSTPIKRMRQDIICIPTTAAKNAVGDSHCWIVDCDTIRVDTVPPPRAILLAHIAASFITRAKRKYF
jgi:hypothetical protein